MIKAISRAFIGLLVFTSFSNADIKETSTCIFGAQSYTTFADSCQEYANNKYSSTAQSLQSNYQDVYQIMQEIEDAYDDLAEALEASNEKLEKMINVAKNKLLQEKKLIFLLKQHNQLYGIQASVRGEQISQDSGNLKKDIIKK